MAKSTTNRAKLIRAMLTIHGAGITGTDIRVRLAAMGFTVTLNQIRGVRKKWLAARVAPPTKAELSEAEANLLDSQVSMDFDAEPTPAPDGMKSKAHWYSLTDIAMEVRQQLIDDAKLVYNDVFTGFFMYIPKQEQILKLVIDKLDLFKNAVYSDACFAAAQEYDGPSKPDVPTWNRILEIHKPLPPPPEPQAKPVANLSDRVAKRRNQ